MIRFTRRSDTGHIGELKDNVVVVVASAREEPCLEIVLTVMMTMNRLLLLLSDIKKAARLQRKFAGVVGALGLGIFDVGVCERVVLPLVDNRHSCVFRHAMVMVSACVSGTSPPVSLPNHNNHKG